MPAGAVSLDFISRLVMTTTGSGMFLESGHGRRHDHGRAGLAQPPDHARIEMVWMNVADEDQVGGLGAGKIGLRADRIDEDHLPPCSSCTLACRARVMVMSPPLAGMLVVDGA